MVNIMFLNTNNTYRVISSFLFFIFIIVKSELDRKNSNNLENFMFSLFERPFLVYISTLLLLFIHNFVKFTDIIPFFSHYLFLIKFFNVIHYINIGIIMII